MMNRPWGGDSSGPSFGVWLARRESHALEHGAPCYSRLHDSTLEAGAAAGQCMGLGTSARAWQTGDINSKTGSHVYVDNGAIVHVHSLRRLGISQGLTVQHQARGRPARGPPAALGRDIRDLGRQLAERFAHPDGRSQFLARLGAQDDGDFGGRRGRAGRARERTSSACLPNVTPPPPPSNSSSSSSSLKDAAAARWARSNASLSAFLCSSAAARAGDSGAASCGAPSSLSLTSTTSASPGGWGWEGAKCGFSCDLEKGGGR